MATSLDDEMRYLNDAQEREDELRRLNEELDKQILNGNNNSQSTESLYATSPSPLPVPSTKSSKFGFKSKTSSAKITAAPPPPSVLQEISGPSSSFPNSSQQAPSPRTHANRRKSNMRAPISSSSFLNNDNDSDNNNYEIDTSEADNSHDATHSQPPSVSSSRNRNPNPSNALFSPSTDAGSPNTNDGPLTSDSFGVDNPDIGPTAQLRFQKARIKTLTLQLSDALSSKKDAETAAQGAVKKSRAEIEEKKRLIKSLDEMKKQYDKLKDVEKTGSEQQDGLKREIGNLKRDLASAKKEAKASDTEHKGREVRLARALEECEKFKETLRQATSDTQVVGGGLRKENDKLQVQIKSLERQRGELLMAFKKQLKLIDVLKRQKVHVEAAKLLAFTEEEFVKVLDWGT